MAEEKESNKKPVYKKWWFWVIVVFVTIGVLGQNKDEGKKVGDNSSSTQTSVQETKKEFKIGDVIAFKGTEVTVTSVQRNFNTGNDFLQPKSGKEYVKVFVQIVNKEKDRVSYNTFDWQIQDSDGSIQNPSFMTTANTDDYLESGELIKGGKKSGSLVFEVNKGDTGLILHYKPSYFSDDAVKIKL